jgi:hypothetical protein
VIRGIQLLGMLVSIYLIIQTLIQFKKGNYGVKRTAFWLSLWTLMAVLFAFPSLTILALPFLAMEDSMLTVLVVGVIVSYVLVYQAYQQAAKTERKLTELAQNMAIRDYVQEAVDDSDEKDDE